MELNKLLKKKERAKNERKKDVLADVCLKIGNYYLDKNNCDDALEEFQEAMELFRDESKRIDEARAHRMIGEVYLKLGKYQDALKSVKRYLKISQEEKDEIEEQRAHTTLARCYMMMVDESSVRAEDVDAVNNEYFRAADKELLKALLISKSLKSIPKYEVADMQARVYLNLGILNEHKSSDDAIRNYETAIKICKSHDLFDLHFSSQMALGACYASKKDSQASLQCYNNALEIAKRIGDGKNEKMCETLLAKATVLINFGDFHSAKQALKKAYRKKTTVESDKMTIQKQLKIANCLCKYEDELVTTDTLDYEKRKGLFEKIGDAACKLKNFTKAIDSYKRQLEVAELNGETGRGLIPIYISLYETYIDSGDFESALEYLNKEYELIKEEPKEAYATLMRKASVLERAKKDFWEIEGVYRKVLALAKLLGDITKEQMAFRKLISVCKDNNMSSMVEMLEQEARERNIDIDSVEEESEDFEFSEDIGVEDYDLIDLSDDDVASSDDDDNNRTITSTGVSTRPRKKKSLTLRKNTKGESKLHEAAINGNYELARRLIEQGHPVNIRDHAGWLPLHEACNYGHRDIVELLLDNGASINDQGGKDCGGITPLIDAATNGSLSVMQLLLDRGAKVNIRNDNRETALDYLRRWYENEADNGKLLDDTQRDFYEEIKGRLVEQCERIGIDTHNNNLLPSSLTSSGIGTGSTNHSSSSSSQRRRFDVNFSDESNSESENVDKSKSQLKRRGTGAGEVYKNVMKSLRNPCRERKLDECDTVIETKKRTAYLEKSEIDPDDWLLDDLGPSRKKQKFFSDNPFKPTSSSFQEMSPQKNNSVLEPISTNVIISDDDDNERGGSNIISDFDDVNAFDVMMMNAENGGGSNVKRKSRRNSQTKSTSQNKSQPSLLDSGFSRFIDMGGDAISSSPRSASHNSSLNMSASIVEKQTTTIIKVQIEDEKIIVPIYQDVANAKISWLIEESAKRYYSLKGIRPVLKLKTADGATLLESDTLSVILCLKEESLIFSEVLDWKLPSLSNRYLEACSELKCGVDRDISDLLDLGSAAIFLDLSNQNFRPSNARPVLKALQHQNCLTQLDLSSNFIQDEGTKYLSLTLITLRYLTVLDLSGNAITEKGIEHLSAVLSKSSLPMEIKCLKLNFNPLKSMKCVSELCRHKSIASLSLAACELAAENIDTLSSVRELDISYNHLSHAHLREILSKLNATVVERINFERCSEDTNMGETLIDFINLSSGSLTELNLSAIRLSENEILNILRCLEQCKKLQNLDLSYQRELSFISLKYILYNIDNKNLRVNLKGCRNLQNSVNSFSHQQHHCQAPTHLPSQILLSIPHKSSEQEKDIFINNIRDLWNTVSAARGLMQIEGNTLKLNIEQCE